MIDSHSDLDFNKMIKMFVAESGEYQRVVAFLKGIPQDVLAKASLRSKAYTRALMHFEAYILENKEDIQDHLTFLQVRQHDINANLIRFFSLILYTFRTSCCFFLIYQASV